MLIVIGMRLIGIGLHEAWKVESRKWKVESTSTFHFLLLTRIRRYIRADKFFEQGQHFTGLSMTAYFFLRKKHFAIYFDIKNTLTACYNGKGVNNVLIILEQIGRRPDGSFTVVSRYTIC